MRICPGRVGQAGDPDDGNGESAHGDQNRGSDLERELKLRAEVVEIVHKPQHEDQAKRCEDRQVTEAVAHGP